MFTMTPFPFSAVSNNLKEEYSTLQFVTSCGQKGYLLTEKRKMYHFEKKKTSGEYLNPHQLELNHMPEVAWSQKYQNPHINQCNM